MTAMWERLGLIITNLERRPGRAESLAASFRQLLRAHDANDPVAVWLATGGFRIAVRLLLKDLLCRESAWDSKERWLQGLSDNTILFQRPRRVHVSGAMVWGLQADTGGRQWADPFEADFELTPDLQDMGSCTVRFGDKRSFAGEDLQTSLSRIGRNIEQQNTNWAFAWARSDIDDPTRTADR